MDPRHETIDLEILNRCVNYLNHFVSANIDEILIQEWLANDIRRIAENIYHYANMEVDISHLIAKKNFLSLDMVQLPIIDDATLCRSERKNSDFSNMISSIELIVMKRNNIDMGQHHFHAGLYNILSEYQLV